MVDVDKCGKMGGNDGKWEQMGGQWGNNTGRTGKKVVHQEKMEKMEGKCIQFSNYRFFYGSHRSHFSGGSDGKLALPNL